MNWTTGTAPIVNFPKLPDPTTQLCTYLNITEYDNGSCPFGTTISPARRSRTLPRRGQRPIRPESSQIRPTPPPHPPFQPRSRTFHILSLIFYPFFRSTSYIRSARPEAMCRDARPSDRISMGDRLARCRISVPKRVLWQGDVESVGADLEGEADRSGQGGILCVVLTPVSFSSSLNRSRRVWLMYSRQGRADQGEKARRP